LFEAWVGDDVVDHPTEGAFWRSCLNAIQQASLRMDVFFMHGNRDFLVGASAIKQAGMQLIADPTQLIWNEKIALLSHGDALCVADTAYQTFRQQVRAPAWQHQFLAQPLDDRLHQARTMRQQSQHMQAQTTQWADMDEPLATQWLMAANASMLIHGHTHRPAHHVLADTSLSRWVLSDWHADATPPRLQVLEWIKGSPLPTVRMHDAPPNSSSIHC
jgi:UDP-2,3-diacylglucosamine hydrolase